MESPSKRNANWLLCGLILVSIAVHVGLFMHLAGVFQPKEWTFIELKLRSYTSPHVRKIPRPPQRHETPPPSRDDTPKLVQPAVARPQPLRLKPVETEYPDTIAEPIESAPPLVAPSPDIAQWQAVAEPNPAAEPGPVATDPGPPDTGESGEYESASAYFSMVRLKIESRKTYPTSAKRRNIEGNVTVGFVLETDGSVSSVDVVKSSRHPALDRAALDAVRNAAPFPKPPETLFRRAIPLRITIVFELT